MTLKELKNKINVLIEEGHWDLPVTVVDGESGKYENIEGCYLQYPLKNSMWDRTQKPISCIVSR